MRSLHRLELTAVHVGNARDLSHREVVLCRCLLRHQIAFLVGHERVEARDASADPFLIDLALEP